MAIPTGVSSPVISDVFNSAPEVVYSAIASTGPSLADVVPTNKFDPETAIAPVRFNPSISDGSTVVPVVL